MSKSTIPHAYCPLPPVPPTLTFAPLPTPSGPSSSRTPLTLIFHPDHPCSTHISDGATGKLVYVIESEVFPEPLFTKRVVTSVRRAAEDAAIAQIQWRDFFSSDMIALRPEIAAGLTAKDSGEGKGLGTGGEGLITMPASSWLKKSLVPFKDTMAYKDPERKGYKWRGLAPGLSLELYSAEYPTYALVKFRKSRHINSSTTTRRVLDVNGNTKIETKVRSRTRIPARLSIDASLVRAGLLDEVVVAFLYLEKIRRERDDDSFRVIPKMLSELPNPVSASKPPATVVKH